MSDCANDAGEAQPATIEAAHNNRLVMRSGEQIIYAGPFVDSNVRPCCTLGSLRSGEPLLHFRNYRTKGKGAWIITREGASFTIGELVIVVNRLRALFPELPELVTAAELGLSRILTRAEE